jgi:hypothetical protein
MAARVKSDVIRRFILEQVEGHPADIASLTATQFGISRQAALKHLRALITEGQIEASGTTRNRRYRLTTKSVIRKLRVAEHQEEDRVWETHVGPLVKDLPRNVFSICYYGFTEMYNNVVSHSESPDVTIAVEFNARRVRIGIIDQGVGVFERIKSLFHVDDHRQALLELSKGKLTTDPKHHTGEGIFFTSRIFDTFSLISSHLALIHQEPIGLWLIEDAPSNEKGTSVQMTIAVDAKRTTKEVFDRFSSDENYSFSRTHVPMNLAKHGEENLVSRSQARRVLARFERFQEVMLDFAGIDSIGQAFADEIFRVFALANPQIVLIAINTTTEVDQMISRARAGGGIR